MLTISKPLLDQITRHVEGTYPNEGGGLLIGRVTDDGAKVLEEIKVFDNQREIEEQYHRILITDRMVHDAEEYADGKGAVLIGFFHSHPDCPAHPSEFDREHALPWWSYVIVSVQQGRTAEVLSWELRDDRSVFDEERVTKLLS
jgi:proteasome lid subunit RPN8/RPN11